MEQNQDPYPQQQVTLTSAVNKPRIFLIGLGAMFLLVVGLVIGYFIRDVTDSPVNISKKEQVSPTPSVVSPTATEKMYKEPASWKTYRNTEYNYSYRYPDTWHDQFTVNKPCEGCGGVEAGLTVLVRKNTAMLSAKDFAQRAIESNRSAQMLPKPEYFTFHNLDGEIANGFPGAGSPGIYAFIVDEGRIYTLQFDGVDDETAHTILNTFYFVKSLGTPGPTVDVGGGNCGPNAGAAGNAQCDAGYTCVYETSEDVARKIGNCIKDK